MIVVHRIDKFHQNIPLEWCVANLAGQHNQGIRTSQGKGTWIWVSGAKPPPIFDIWHIRNWSTTHGCNETLLRRLLTVRTEWSRK